MTSLFLIYMFIMYFVYVVCMWHFGCCGETFLECQEEKEKKSVGHTSQERVCFYFFQSAASYHLREMAKMT